MRREFFYLPLFAGSLIASLLASRRTLPRWLRVLLGLGAIPLALAMLPPAWTLPCCDYRNFACRLPPCSSAC